MPGPPPPRECRQWWVRTYVAKDDTVRRVDVERLCLGVGRAAGGGVPHCSVSTGALARPLFVVRLPSRPPRVPSCKLGHTVTHTHPALQARDRRRVKDVTDHAVRLDLVEATARAAGDDAGRILATAQSVACPGRDGKRGAGADIPMLQERETLGTARQRDARHDARHAGSDSNSGSGSHLGTRQRGLSRQRVVQQETKYAAH